MKEIGYLLDIDLIQELNAVELLKLYSLYENKGYNLKKTEEALQEFKLPRDSKIKEYSYGMQQRLRLLLALDETRQLLILDEPLLGLDITSIDLMKKVLKQFVSQGGSVLLSSHQLAEIQDIVDRYIILDDGIINEEFTGNSVVFQVEVRSELGEFVKLTSLLNECDVLFQKEEEHRRLYVDPENLNRVLQEAFKLNLEVNIEQKNIINQTLLRKSKVGSNE